MSEPINEDTKIEIQQHVEQNIVKCIICIMCNREININDKHNCQIRRTLDTESLDYIQIK